MEILSFLNQHGRTGEIIHGSVDYIAKRVDVLAKVAKAQQKLNGTRLGVIGQPSDWLISSAADPVALSGKLGITLVDIPIS
jgi:L-fucose isomerase-like protein